MKQINILGVPFSITDQRTLLERIHRHIQRQEKSFVITANPEIVMRAKDEPSYMETLHRSSYITADGIGIVRASQLLGQAVPERVTGYDMMIELLQLSQVHQYKIYLLGAHPETLRAAREAIHHMHPDIQVVGSHDGYFDWNDNHIVEDIKEKQPDIIFVALGAPKQEKWIAEHFQEFDHGVFLCVGGSIDVLGGKMKRAPIGWQKLHLEWMYRLLKQPSRWRRMLALPRFAYHVLRQKVRS